MLRLIKLELEGFGCFKDKKEFLYENGINVIRAENGSGKTTQINAISILLLSEYEGSFADYMNRECTEFIISLEFMLNGKHLLETLACKKGKSYTTTRNLKDIDGNDVANGEGVKEWLNERLPVSTSKYALFVRQNSDMDIIHCSDSERRDLFKRIQDLDYAKEIKTLIEPKIEQTKDKIIEVDKEIFALENKAYTTKDFIELPFTEDEYNLKKNKLDKLNAQKTLVEERKARFDELTSSKNKILNEITSIENISAGKKISIINCNDFIKNSESEKEKIIADCEKNKKEIENKISDFNNQFNNLDNLKDEEIKNIQNSIDNVTKEIENITTEMNNIKIIKLIKFDDDLLIKTRNNLSELKTKSSIAWKNAEQLKNGICPICGSKCDDKHQSFEDEAISYDKMISECEITVEELVQKKNEYDENVKKNQENKEQKLSFQNQIENKTTKLNNIKESLNNITFKYESKKQEINLKIDNELQKQTNEHEKCESDLKAIDDKVELYKKQKSEYESIIVENDKKITDLNKELEEVNEKLSKYDDSNKTDFSEIDFLSNELKKYDDITSQNKVVKEYNEQLEETKKADKKELEKFKERKQKFEKEKFDLENSKKILTTDYPSWAILQNLKNIENDINEFIDQVYYKPLNIKFDMTRGGISMRFGDDIKVERLSGAEKAITNIGFCESFNKNLNLNMILLDEPDAPLSATRKEMFYSSLLEMKDVFEQMIVVTHSKDMVAYIQANDTDCNIITL